AGPVYSAIRVTAGSPRAKSRLPVNGWEGGLPQTAWRSLLFRVLQRSEKALCPDMDVAAAHEAAQTAHSGHRFSGINIQGVADGPLEAVQIMGVDEDGGLKLLGGPCKFAEDE